MATDYLNKNGLSYFWSKLKAYFAPKAHTHNAFETKHSYTTAANAAKNWYRIANANTQQLDTSKPIRAQFIVTAYNASYDAGYYETWFVNAIVFGRQAHIIIFGGSSAPFSQARILYENTTANIDANDRPAIDLYLNYQLANGTTKVEIEEIYNSGWTFVADGQLAASTVPSGFESVASTIRNNGVDRSTTADYASYLNRQISNITAAFTLADSYLYRSRTLNCTGTFTITIPSINSGYMWCVIKNKNTSSGVITLHPSTTSVLIDGSNADIKLQPMEYVCIHSAGANNYSLVADGRWKSQKADKATTLAGYGITDAKIVNGTITLGSNSITPITSIDDSNYVHKTGDELVEGIKTFKNAYHDSTVVGETDFLSSSVIVRMSDYVKGSVPSANRYANILFMDRDGSNVNWGGRLGQVETIVAPSGAHSTTLVAVKNEVIDGVDTRDSALIRVGYTAAGVKYATCPSTPAAADGSANDILTRDWIPSDGRIVHMTGDETIGGSKTFANTTTFRATTQNCLRFVNTSVTAPNYPPSDTTYYQGMTFYDSAEAVNIGSFYTRVQSDRSALVWYIRSFSGASQQFALTMLSTGESYLTGPTPLSTAEDSVKIPTTEWVRDATGNFACNAATATKLASARNINISDAGGTNVGTAISFDGSAGGVIKLPSTIEASITGSCSGSSGSCTGNAATATKLKTARTLYARLDTAYDSSNPVQFDGSAGKALPVYGTLPVANGGTGSSTKNFVDLSTTQTVGGTKIFSASPAVRNGSPRLYMNDSDHTKDSSSTVPYASLTAGDKDGVVCGAIAFHCYGNSVRNPCYSFMLYDPTESTADTARTINFRWQRTDTSTDVVQFMPSVTALFNLGAGSVRWKQLYISESAVSTSDERLKDFIEPVPDQVLDAWAEVDFCQFKMRSAVEEKGADGARLHGGLIAQRARDAFAAHGLDASRYGFFCYDEWEADEVEGVPAGDQYSVRYAEALCMEAAYMRRENARLKRRVADLEERLAALELKIS